MRALLVSYVFPPVGGAGVQRMLKLAKYLPEHGVTPAVLTARNPSVPVLDPSLLLDLPRELEVERTRTLEPAYAAKALAWRAAAERESGLGVRITAGLTRAARSLLVPDPQVLWLPSAAGALAARLISRRSVDVVLVSGPPFSSHALALLARLRPGVGVVLDYRDEWTTTRQVYEMAGSAAFDSVLEQACLRAAHKVTTATGAFRRQLLDRFAFLRSDDVVSIENGYDPDDFRLDHVEPARDRLVLTYTGTVFRLTSAAGLLEAVRRLHAREPERAKRLEIRFVGRIVDTEARFFEGTEALGVRRIGYVEHARALQELAACHVALCLLDDCAGAARVYPAKIFEIMALRRPCLALCPEGELASLVRSQRLGEVVPPRDAERIAAVLSDLLCRFESGQLPLETHPVDPERFDRRRQAGLFAEVMHSARAKAARPRPSLSPGKGPAQPLRDSLSTAQGSQP